jgi:hypothetical protein
MAFQELLLRLERDVLEDFGGELAWQESERHDLLVHRQRLDEAGGRAR